MKSNFQSRGVSVEAIVYPERVNTTRFPFMPFLLGILILIAAVITWKEITKKKADGTWTLTEEFVDDVLNELEKTEQCETYILTARTSGWYLCKHCARGSYYLNAGETYKIGISCGNYSRYNPSWLAQMRLNYTVVFRGDMKAARQHEIRLLGRYPISPENLVRPENLRLALPPGNNQILK